MLEIFSSILVSIAFCGFLYYGIKKDKYITKDTSVLLNTSDFLIPTLSGSYCIEIGTIKDTNYNIFSRQKYDYTEKPIFDNIYHIHNKKHYHTFPIIKPFYLGEKGLSVLIFKKHEKIKLLYNFTSNDIVNIIDIAQMYENFLHEHHSSAQLIEICESSDENNE
jgi:hypothetical protein